MLPHMSEEHILAKTNYRVHMISYEILASKIEETEEYVEKHRID